MSAPSGHIGFARRLERLDQADRGRFNRSRLSRGLLV